MITVNLYYTGKNGSARAFCNEMESSGTADEIRSESGNLRYQYFQSLSDPETVLLIDSWRDQAVTRTTSWSGKWTLTELLVCFRMPDMKSCRRGETWH